MGFCGCGCGATVRRRYVRGHQIKGVRRVAVARRYRMASDGERIQLVHRMRAERALGRPLPSGAQVHHADGSRSDDAPLVICQDAAYHKLLHRRMRILGAGGNPNTDKVCSKCRAVKARDLFYRNRAQADGLDPYCKQCRSAREVSFGLV